MTLILGWLLEKTLGFRVSRDAELEGIDLTEHAESAYDYEGNLGGGFGGGGGVATATKKKIAVDTDTEAISVTDEEVTA